MRPLPSIRTEATPRRASWAATIVPENPPPIMATGVRCSDIIVGPLLRLARSGADLLHVEIGLGDDAPRCVGEPAGDDAVNHCRQPGADQPEADLQRARAMLEPAQPERARMIGE